MLFSFAFHYKKGAIIVIKLNFSLYSLTARCFEKQMVYIFIKYII